MYKRAETLQQNATSPWTTEQLKGYLDSQAEKWRKGDLKNQLALSQRLMSQLSAFPSNIGPRDFANVVSLVTDSCLLAQSKYSAETPVVLLEDTPGNRTLCWYTMAGWARSAFGNEFANEVLNMLYEAPTASQSPIAH